MPPRTHHARLLSVAFTAVKFGTGFAVLSVNACVVASGRVVAVQKLALASRNGLPAGNTPLSINERISAIVGSRHPMRPLVVAPRHEGTAEFQVAVVRLGSRSHTRPVSWSRTAALPSTHRKRVELQPASGFGPAAPSVAVSARLHEPGISSSVLPVGDGAPGGSSEPPQTTPTAVPISAIASTAATTHPARRMIPDMMHLQCSHGSGGLGRILTQAAQSVERLCSRRQAAARGAPSKARHQGRRWCFGYPPARETCADSIIRSGMASA